MNHCAPTCNETKLNISHNIRDYRSDANWIIILFFVLLLTNIQNINAVRAVLLWVFWLRTRKLAVYERRDSRASVASFGDISRTSANLLKRTLRMLESSLSVPDIWSAFSGTYVESLCEWNGNEQLNVKFGLWAVPSQNGPWETAAKA